MLRLKALARPFTFIKSNATSRKTAAFPGFYAVCGLKIPFFWAIRANVYFQLTLVRLFSEAVGSKPACESPLNPAPEGVTQESHRHEEDICCLRRGRNDCRFARRDPRKRTARCCRRRGGRPDRRRDRRWRDRLQPPGLRRSGLRGRSALPGVPHG